MDNFRPCLINFIIPIEKLDPCVALNLSLVGMPYRFIYWILFCGFTGKQVETTKCIIFKSNKNYKRPNKGSFTLKSNLNKIMLCRGGREDFNITISFFKSLYNFLNNIFNVKGLTSFTFNVKLKSIF